MLSASPQESALAAVAKMKRDPVNLSVKSAELKTEKINAKKFMTESEELKHAHARIEADGKTIAELREWLANPIRCPQWIHDALDKAGAPEFHPIAPGTEEAKPMMPTERIRWLASRLDNRHWRAVKLAGDVAEMNQRLIDRTQGMGAKIAELRMDLGKETSRASRWRTKLQAMHRRAQRAESRVRHVERLYDKWRGQAEFWHSNFREHFAKQKADEIHEAELRLSVTGPADGWKDGGPHYVPGQVEAIRINASQLGRTQTVAEWTEDHFETFYNAALGAPWVQPEPEIIDVHGRDYYAHTPGDACPCDGALEVHVLWRIELSEPMILPGHYGRADSWIWDRKPEHKGHEAIAWRPKDAPDKLPRYVKGGDK